MSKKASATAEKRSGVSAKRKRKQAGAQLVPQRKRFAPKSTPGIPGQGDIKQYHAVYRDDSVWILDATEALDLSMRGSFGKGTLSRSVPDFAKRQTKSVKQAVHHARLVERDLVQQTASWRASLLEHESAPVHDAATASTSDARVATNDVVDEEYVPECTAPPAKAEHIVTLEDDHSAAQAALGYAQGQLLLPDGEPLQLCFEEAFFLMFALKCLSIETADQIELTVEQAWRLFQRLNDRFVELYIAYHFHRSRGWCPKQGLKFGSDWILYKKGPQYHHASYQVIVHPINREEFDSGDALRYLSWPKVHHLNRLA